MTPCCVSLLLGAPQLDRIAPVRWRWGGALSFCVLWDTRAYFSLYVCKCGAIQCLLMSGGFLIILSAHATDKNHGMSECRTAVGVTLPCSRKVEGPCHKIWLVGHLSRHEQWEEGRRRCHFTGNIWAEIPEVLGRDFCYPAGCQNPDPSGNEAGDLTRLE